MLQRRHSPYSRIEDIRQSRDQLLGLIVVTVVLGILLGLLVNGLYEYLTIQIRAPELQMLIFVFGVFLVVAILWMFTILRYQGTESERLRIDVALPFQLAENGSTVEITKQHRFRPVYQPAKHGRMLFLGTIPSNSIENRELAEQWRALRSEGKPVQMVLADFHDDLVDALILFALHRHSEDSLGGAAQYGWWHVQLEGYDVGYDGLPSLLQNNRFLRKRMEIDKDWKLRLPVGVAFTMKDNEDGTRIFSLRCPHRGGVRITRLPMHWVATRDSQPGKVLSEGADIPRKDWFYVIGSRVEVQAKYRNAVLSRSDNYQQWAADMLARLEESLDLAFFLATTSCIRMIPDINWKIGDIPDMDDSLWKSIQAIERQLESIKQELNRATMTELLSTILPSPPPTAIVAILPADATAGQSTARGGNHIIVIQS